MLWSSSSIVPVANSLFALVGGRISASLRLNAEMMDAMAAGYFLCTVHFTLWLLPTCRADCRRRRRSVAPLLNLCTTYIPNIRGFICSSVCRLFLTGCLTFLVRWAGLESVGSDHFCSDRFPFFIRTDFCSDRFPHVFGPIRYLCSD